MYTNLTHKIQKKTCFRHANKNLNKKISEFVLGKFGFVQEYI